MRFAAILGTKDEVDILPTTIAQLRRIGVELTIVRDIGSTDGTLEYLAEAEREGDIWVVHQRESDLDSLRRDAYTSLARSCGAEWVLFLDSDELPLPRSGSLHDLDDLDVADVLAVPRYNVVLGEDGPLLPDELTPDRYDEIGIYAGPIPDFFHYMQRHPDTPWIRGGLEPKTLIRTDAIEAVERGAHDAETRGDGWRRATAHDLLLAHVPLRSLERYQARARNVRSATRERPAEFQSYDGWQWSRLARMEGPEQVEAEYRHQTVDDAALAELRADGVVRSVAEVYDQPITPARSEDGWLAMAARAEPWLTAASMVSRREAVTPTSRPQHVSGAARFPVVSLPPDHVVKFYARWQDGDAVADRELEVLRALEADPELPAPRAVASGALERELRYILMTRAPGVALSSIDYELDDDERRTVAAWLGRFVAALQSIPVDDELRATGWAAFEAATRERLSRAAGTGAQLGLSPRLVARLPGWLPDAAELTGSVDDAVLSHGQLDADHLLGRPAAPRFEPRGVIDFDRASVGARLADLGSVWWSIARGDRRTLRSWLVAAGLLETVDADPRTALAWALTTAPSTEAVISEAADAEDPDELAERWFGGLAEP